MIFIVLLLNVFIVYFAKSSASLAAAFTLLALAPELSYRSHITHITTTLPYLDSQLEHRTSQPQQPTANTKTKHTNYSILKQTYTLVPLKYIRMIASHSRPRSRDPISIFVYLVFAHWHSTHFAFTNHFFLSFYVFLLSSAFSSLFWCYYCSYCFGLPTFVFFLFGVSISFLRAFVYLMHTVGSHRYFAWKFYFFLLSQSKQLASDLWYYYTRFIQLLLSL